MAMVATGPTPGNTPIKANERVHQVLQGESHPKTEGEVVKQFHEFFLLNR
jgi:hypothetical protein